MSGLLTISLFIKPCQERERVCSLKRCSISSDWQLLFVPWIYSFGECIYYLFFSFPPAFRSPAGLCKASGRTCLCCYETRFQTPSNKGVPTWFWSQTCGAPWKTQTWSYSLFSWGSPQMAGELQPTLAIFDIAKLILGKALPSRKHHETQFSGISVRYFSLWQVKSEERK